MSCSTAHLLCSQKTSSNYGFDAWEGNLSGKEQGRGGDMSLLHSAEQRVSSMGGQSALLGDWQITSPHPCEG